MEQGPTDPAPDSHDAVARHPKAIPPTLAVETPIEVPVQCANVPVAIVGPVGPGAAHAIGVAIEGTQVAVAIVGASIPVAVESANVVVAARRTGVAQSVEGADIAGPAIHVTEVAVGLRGSVAVAVAIAVTPARIQVSVKIAIVHAYISIAIPVAASNARHRSRGWKAGDRHDWLRRQGNGDDETEVGAERRHQQAI